MIIKNVKPPVQDKLKAHYFDRYSNTFEGNKLLSSVGDQSEGREIQPGRCYDFDGVDDYIAIVSADIGMLYISGLDENGNLITSGLSITYVSTEYRIAGIGKIWNIKVWLDDTATEDAKKDFTSVPSFAWYKCDEGTGINSYDSSGNGHHGTITNASLETFHSTQNIYSWQNEVGYSEDVSPVGGFELSNDNWVKGAGDNNNWIFTGTEAIHVSSGGTTHPVYFDPRELNLVMGVEYAITMIIEETNGMVGFSVLGGIPNNARRNTAGQITSKFISDGQKIRCFTYENVDCIISDISVVAIGLVPALNDKVDIYGGELHYKGQVAYNALLKQSNCLYLDGIDDIIQFADTTGWDRLENAGTSELSINGNNIEGTEGSVYNLRVYDGSDNLIHLFPCSEGGGARINCVLGGTIGTLVNTTLETVWAKQDEYHFNLEHGWSSGKGFSIRSNDTPVVSDSSYRFISQEGISYYFVYNDEGNPDTGRFDPDGNPLGYTSEYFNFYRQYVTGGVTGGNNVFSVSGAFLSNTLTIDIEMFAGNGISIQAYDGTLEGAFRQELNNRYGVGESTYSVFQTAEMFYLALSGTDAIHGENYPETIGFPVGVTSADLRQVMTDVGFSDVPFFLSEYGKFGGTGGASASWWNYGLVRAYSQRIYRLDLDGRTKLEIRNVDALATGGRSNLSGDYFTVTDRLMERFGSFTIRSLSDGLWARFYQVSINENHRTPASLTNHNQDATGLKLENVAGRYHNGAETLIDFTGGVEDNPYAVERNLPTDYAFNQNYLFKDQSMKGVRESNILVTDANQGEELLTMLNYLKRKDGTLLSITNTTSIDISIETMSGNGFQVDWGDGVVTEHPSGNSYVEHLYTTPYSGDIMLIVDPDDVLRFRSRAGRWSFDISVLSVFSNMEAFNFSSAQSTIYGDIKNIPRKLKELRSGSSPSNIYGSIADLPPNIESVTLYGSGGLVGLTIDMPRTVTSFTDRASGNSLTGDVADLPENLRGISISPPTGFVGDLADLPRTLAGSITIRGGALHGDIADLPPNIINLDLKGSNTVTGDIANISSNMVTFILHGNNTVYGDIAYLPPSISRFDVIGDNTVTGDIANISSNMVNFILHGSNTVYGDIADLKEGFKSFHIFGNNTTHGDIMHLPSTMTGYQNNGLNTTTGNISELPIGLTTYRNIGLNTTTGDLGLMPSTITFFENRGRSTIDTYTSKTWGTIERLNSTPYMVGLSTSDIDQLLIDLSTANWTGNSVINLTGGNAPRSSASDAAVTLLQSKGVTVTTN